MENESIVRKILFHEVTVVLGIVVYTALIFGAYYNVTTRLALLEQRVSENTASATDVALIKQDVNTIKTNELVHIAGQLNDMKNRNDLQDQKTIELGTKLERVLAILGAK